MAVACILLAAGESTRMGSPKPLLPWQGGNLIQYHLRELAGAGVGEVVVVLGHRASDVAPYVRGVKLVVNDAYREGRASSLRAGAIGLENKPDQILVLSVDQPRPREVIAAVLAAHKETGALITVPVFEGKRGHPPAMAGSLLRELASVTEETQGLRAVMLRHAADVREIAVDSPLVIGDINTPEDYARAKAAFGRASI